MQECVINQVFRLITQTRRSPHYILIEDFVWENDDLAESGFECLSGDRRISMMWREQKSSTLTAFLIRDYIFLV